MSRGGDIDLPTYEKDEKAVKLIEGALLSSVFLQNITNNRRALKAIINAMQKKTVNAKTKVTESGKSGDEMYVCAEGNLIMFDSSGNHYLKTIGPGDLFGEMAFICFSKRKTNVRAQTKCKLWVLNQSDYSKILRRYFTFKDEDYIKFLRSIPILQKLNDDYLLQLRTLMRVECYPANIPILIEGEEGSDFFIITGGTVTVNVVNSDERVKTVARLRKGDFFGEGALLENARRRATVMAEFPGVECIILKKEHFCRFLKDLAVIQSVYRERYDSTREIIDHDIEYSFVNLSDLEYKGTIANSNIGSVDLVQYKPDQRLVFALKTLKKIYVAELDAVKNAINEKNILLPCRSPFIIRLYKVFKDEKYLYYLEEVCLGGSLKHLMNEIRFCDEKLARFIAACVTEALDYLHYRRIVYRNLKLENLVFDSKGYVKMVDFGYARKYIDFHNSEGSSSQTHQKSCNICQDYFSLGSLIFEMLVGSSPFEEADNIEKTLTIEDIKIKNFPLHITKQAKLIIKKLWRTFVNQGEECKEDQINAIKTHKWYEDFKWASLEDGTMPAPYIPKIQHSTDLSNFDEVKRDREVPPNYTGDWEIEFVQYICSVKSKNCQ